MKQIPAKTLLPLAACVSLFCVSCTGDPSSSAQPTGLVVKQNEDLLKAKRYIEERKYSEAITALGEVIKAEPNKVEYVDMRGDCYLKAGQFKEAIADFDTFLKSNPMFEPEHWRRGIAYYYAGQYTEGVKQFETHKKVNPQDVENAVWHYLCHVKVAGKEKALADLIDVTQDTRVPMAEVQKLFAGKIKPEDVLNAANKTKEDQANGISARLYAHLYLGLWYESEGNAEKAKEHMNLAVKFENRHYMYDVAVAHARILNKK